MPRGPRLDAPGVLHHVMARGIERRKIFIEEADYQDFVDRQGKVLVEGGGVCYAWSLMPNHFHLLLRTGSVPLVRVMQRLLTGYAVNFNFRHKRAGHLFQNRYKSIVVEEEPYLLELVRYIHLNPLRAKLVPGLEGLDRYPWSGHAVLMGRRKAEGQEVEEVLGRFSENLGPARRKYRVFVEEGVSQGRRPELQGGGLIRSLGGWEEARKIRRKEDWVRSDARILGGGDFVTRVLKDTDVGAVEKPISILDLIIRVSEIMGVGADSLKGGRKNPEITRARAVVVYIAVEKLKIRGMELAKELGLGQSAVSRLVIRGREIYSQSEDLRERLKLNDNHVVKYVP